MCQSRDHLPVVGVPGRATEAGRAVPPLPIQKLYGATNRMEEEARD
jgi:hypothetical protein